MELITVRELFKNTEKYVDKEIEIGGWVRNKRPSKQFGFIVLNDGTYFTPVQVVYNDSIENFQEISKINGKIFEYFQQISAFPLVKSSKLAYTILYFPSKRGFDLWN